MKRSGSESVMLAYTACQHILNYQSMNLFEEMAQRWTKSIRIYVQLAQRCTNVCNPNPLNILTNANSLCTAWAQHWSNFVLPSPTRIRYPDIYCQHCHNKINMTPGPTNRKRKECTYPIHVYKHQEHGLHVVVHC